MRQKKQRQLSPSFAMAAASTTMSEMRKLLERGLQMDLKDDGHGLTPLHWAAGFNHRPGIIQMLLDAGADMEARAGWRDNTPLHEACRNKNTAVIRLLLETGADVNARNKGGHSPIDILLGEMIYSDDLDHFEEALDLFREYAPEATLKSVLDLPPDVPLREKLLDLFREYAPELVMEAYCTQT